MRRRFTTLVLVGALAGSLPGSAIAAPANTAPVEPDAATAPSFVGVGEQEGAVDQTNVEVPESTATSAWVTEDDRQDLSRFAPHYSDYADDADDRSAFPPAQLNPTTEGTQPLLIILAESSNRTSIEKQQGRTRQQIHAAYARLINGTSGRTIRTYYDTQSDGTFRFTPARESNLNANDGVVGWVNTDLPHPTYDGGIDTAAAAVRAAIAKSSRWVNYGQYDRNGNGHIEPSELHLVVIFAGYTYVRPMSDGCAPKQFRGHRYSLETGVQTDGVSVARWPHGSYVAQGEWTCYDGFEPGARGTLGTFVHELGHDLGLPDLYHEIDPDTKGAGPWALMSTGSNNGPTPTPERPYTAGRVPAGMTAFSRYQLGWLQPRVVGPGAGTRRNLQLGSISPGGGGAVLIGNNPNGPDWHLDDVYGGAGEYFLVEYRRKQGWDEYLPGCGVLIWHVNEAMSTNDYQPQPIARLEGRRPNNEGQTPYKPATRTVFGPGTQPNSNWYDPAHLYDVSRVPIPSGVRVEVKSGCGSNQVTLDVPGPKAPPANDNFGSARDLTGRSLPISASGTNVNATRQSNEPDPAYGADVERREKINRRSVWWKWTAPFTGGIAVDTVGSNFDTTVTAYTGDNIGNLTQVAVNNDISSDNRQSRAGVPVVKGRTYHLAVRGWEGYQGQIDLNLKRLTMRTPTRRIQESAGDFSLKFTLDQPALGNERFRVQLIPTVAMSRFDGPITSSNIGLRRGTTTFSLTYRSGDDDLGEPDLAYRVRLLPADTDSPGISLRGTPTVTIVDDDPPSQYSIYGSDRIETAVQVSQNTWVRRGEDGRRARVAVLASARGYADALVGTPLAVQRQGPMLLTNPGELHSAIRDELTRILPRGATVFVLGGEAALAARIDQQIRDLEYRPVRVKGADRYETAVEVARRLGNRDKILLATGRNFPDALAAGVAASRANGVVLLTANHMLPPATRGYLDSHKGMARFAIGGQAAAAVPGATGLVGKDRYETAAITARRFDRSPQQLVGVAAGHDYPDALAGGVLTALAGGVLVLAGATTLPDPTVAYLRDVEPRVVLAYGGTAAISNQVRDRIENLLDEWT